MGCPNLTYHEELTPFLRVQRSDNTTKNLTPDFLFSIEKSSAGTYRYGFQGQEEDNEVKGDGSGKRNGNSVNYKFRMHDPRLGRFFAVDPLTASYPHYTPYSFSGNKVVHAVELEGLEEFEVNEDGGSDISSSAVFNALSGPLSDSYTEENNLQTSERYNWSIAPILSEKDFVYYKSDEAIDPRTGKNQCCQAAKVQSRKAGGSPVGGRDRIDTYNQNNIDKSLDNVPYAIAVINESLENGIPIVVGIYNGNDANNGNPSTGHFVVFHGRSMDDKGNKYYMAMDNASKWRGKDPFSHGNHYYILDYDMDGPSDGKTIMRPIIGQYTSTEVELDFDDIIEIHFEEEIDEFNIVTEVRRNSKLKSKITP